MARISMKLPTDIIEELEKLENKEMMTEMCNVAADKVVKNIHSGADKVFEDATKIKNCIFKSATYTTPSDDALNVKVMCHGYFTNKQGKKVAAPTVVCAREYGTSRGEARKPFFRKGFKSSEIKAAMLEVQKKYIKE